MKCNQCGGKFSALGRHWYASSKCNFPDFSEYEHQVITGLLMGDGCIDASTKNPSLVVNMTNKDFLEHLHDIFGNKSCGVSFMRSAENQVEQGTFSNEVGNYNDQYRWKTRTNPQLNEYRSWYDSGKKEFPENLNLTPTILKYWYVCDGTYDTSGCHNRISIAASNEIGNEDKINSYFESADIPKPSNWNITERSSGGMRCNIYWTNENTKELFDYMGKAPPGFDGKWSTERFKY